MNKEIDFSDKPYYLEYQNLIYKGPNFHRDILELLFVMRGEIKITIEDEVSILKSGDFICVNPGSTHIIEGGKNTYISSLYLDLKHYETQYPFILGVRFYCKYFSGVSTDLDEYLALRNYIIRLMLMDSVQMPMQKKLSIELCDIMIDILIHHIYDEVYLKNKIANLKDSDRDRILSISKLINENYKMRGFSLSEMAEIEHISPTRLSHFWKAMTNMSFKDTINMARFMESKRLLMEGELSINKIVEKCGYSDEKYLYRSIKDKYGITPAEFRKQHQETLLIPDEYTVINTKKAEAEVIEYGYKFYVKIRDLSFLIGRFDEIEEENLNELYSIITTATKKKVDGKEIQSDRTVLNLGIDSGLRHMDDGFEINWEYIHGMADIITNLFDNCNISINVELMSSEKWFEIFDEIRYVFYEVWGNVVNNQITLLVTYRGYENLEKARAFAEEACSREYFRRATPVLYL